MAQYWTDFSDRDERQFLSDNGWSWIYREDESPSSIVTSRSDASGGQLASARGNNPDNAFAWDGRGGDDVEIVSRHLFDPFRNRPMARARKDETARTAYYAVVAPGPSEIRIYKEVDGTETELAAGTVSGDFDEYYWIRFRVNGDTLSARAWEAGDSEPGSWQVQTTDSDIDEGWTGWHCDADTGFGLDVIGVGTEGDSAPMTDPTVTPTETPTDTPSVQEDQDEDSDSILGEILVMLTLLSVPSWLAVSNRSVVAALAAAIGVFILGLFAVGLVSFMVAVLAIALVVAFVGLAAIVAWGHL